MLIRFMFHIERGKVTKLIRNYPNFLPQKPIIIANLSIRHTNPVFVYKLSFLPTPKNMRGSYQ